MDFCMAGVIRGLVLSFTLHFLIFFRVGVYQEIHSCSS